MLKFDWDMTAIGPEIPASTKANNFSNAIMGIAPFGGAGIYGSCREKPTYPDKFTFSAGYFDGDVLVHSGNILVSGGVVQADKMLPQNGWSGRFKGKQ